MSVEDKNARVKKSMEIGIRLLSLAFPWDIMKTVLERVDKRLIEDFF